MLKSSIEKLRSNMKFKFHIKLNKNKLLKQAKLALVFMIALITSVEAITSCVTYTKAGGYSDDLGTAKGIGSPILNSNFTIENWNKWEMICWGLFLSNFCTPLVDDYSSAFQATGTGSNGAGYQALVFGSGNDANNNQVIKDLCSYAISQQKATPNSIYVTYSKLKGTNIIETVDPNNCDGTDYVRLAKFQDLFFAGITGLESHTDIKNETSAIKTDISILKLTKSDNVAIYDAAVSSYSVDMNDADFAIAEAYLPTFWIKKNGTEDQYVKILDYTNSWDVQIVSAITSAITTADSDIMSQFSTNFSTNWDRNTDIKLDCFGNIVTYDNKMIVPGSANQNLTKERKINLLNSFILNNSSINSTGDKLVQYASQYEDKALLSSYKYDNFPALSGTDSKLNDGACFLYYDIDSVYLKNKGIGYGDALKELFNQDIHNNVHEYPLHLEVIRKITDSALPWNIAKDSSGVSSYPLTSSQLAVCTLANQLNNSEDAEILTYYTTLKGENVSIIDKPVAIPVKINTNTRYDATESITRGIVNLFYKMYTGEVSETTFSNISQSTLSRDLSSVTDLTGFKKYLEDLHVWDHYKAYKSMNNSKYSVSSIWADGFTDNTLTRNKSRIILAYPTSSVMNAVASIFGLRDGSEFSTYSALIYMTYLDWYGITTSTSLIGDTSNRSDFNPDIFHESMEILQVDPSEVTEIKSEAEMEDEVLRYAYLMLSPEAGRSYRASITTSAVSDWMYEHYQKICYGTASDNNGISTKNNNSFLNTPSVADNPFLSWIVDKYAKIASAAIMFMIIATIVIGLLNGRKLTWYIATMFTIVNTLLLLPSMGDLVPYASNKVIQSMFSNRMTFWSISEAISNAAVEKDAVTKSGELEGLSDDEANQIMYLVKNLNTLNLDKTLMIKKDISSKTIQKVDESFSDVQSIQSARWLLPLIMRQYSDDTSNNDYLYTSVGDLFDDLSNLYWYYIPADASNTDIISPTMTSGDEGAITFEDSEGTALDEYYKTVSSVYPDFKDTSQSDSVTDIKFKSYSYTATTAEHERVHRYSYILKDTSLASFNDYVSRNGFNGEETYEGYSIESKTASNSFISKAVDIMKAGNAYDRTDRSTLNQEYGYLWTTETPTHYFYQNIKESFSSTMSFGKAIGDIQGKITEDKNGVEQRDSFMFATEEYNGNTYSTGYTRDVLDLEELFTNVVPYIYQVMLVTGGIDGDHGVLVTNQVNQYGQVEEVPLLIDDTYWEYEGINQSWLFRSNWVVKLTECPEYTKQATVYDKDGNKYIVSNPLMPDMYPSNRPMIFSEAQMHAYGLEEADLNIVELKCIKVNNEVVNRWTLMLNYAGTSGMTLEILERQMAIDSTMAFCEVFSPSGILNTTYKLYPTSLDLRNISFDSVMRMLMLNISNDTSYIYGDTMLRVIENADIFTGMMLLIVAVICAYIVPFVKCLMTAALTLLGFVSLIQNITASTKYKYKVTCSCLVCNILFFLLTIFYYSVFSMMLATTSSDDVLTMSSVQLESQNPMGCLIIILVVSLLYLYAMFSELKFVVRNSSDMGSEIIFYQLGQLKNTVRTVGSNFGNAVKRTFGGQDSFSRTSSSGSSGKSSTKDTSMKGSKHSIEDDDFEEEYTSKKKKKNSRSDSESYEKEENNRTKSSYYSDVEQQTTKNSYRSINEEINKGARMQPVNIYESVNEYQNSYQNIVNNSIDTNNDTMDYDTNASFTLENNYYSSDSQEEIKK